MDNLISGLLGALIATVLAIFYQHIRVICDRKYETASSAVKFFDEIFFHFRQVNIYYKLKHTGSLAKYSRDISIHKNKIDDLVISSKIHALVALNYGLESEVLNMVNDLRDKLFNASLLLFRVNKENWGQTEEQFNAAFSNEIDPLRNLFEVKLMNGATFIKTLKPEIHNIFLVVKKFAIAVKNGSLGK